jgi:ribosome-associated protein
MEILPIPTSHETASNRSLDLALTAARVAAENRGRDIVILDLRDVTPVFDYFVIATGASRRQLHAICEEIDQALEVGMRDHRLGREGFEASRWILLDYGNIVVHLFDEETRQYYDLENLWGAGKRVPVPELAPRAAAGQ